MPFARDVLHYIQDMFDLGSSLEFDEGVFQSYQSIGRSLCARPLTNGSNQSLTARLAVMLGGKLDAFNSSWQLYCGLRMERLWLKFKPATASTLLQLDLALQIRNLADRFHSLKWSAGASVQELGILRDSLARAHDTVVAASTTSFEPLMVCLFGPWRCNETNEQTACTAQS